MIGVCEDPAQMGRTYIEALRQGFQSDLLTVVLLDILYYETKTTG